MPLCFFLSFLFILSFLRFEARHFLTLGECPDTIFSLEYSSNIRKGLGNLSPAHFQEEKDDMNAENKET